MPPATVVGADGPTAAVQVADYAGRRSATSGRRPDASMQAAVGVGAGDCCGRGRRGEVVVVIGLGPCGWVWSVQVGRERDCQLHITWLTVPINVEGNMPERQ
jgi:hypothetical protein